MAILLAILLFPFLWIAVVRLLLALAGWGRLTEAWPDRTSASAIATKRWQSAAMRYVGFRGSLHLDATGEGLRLRLTRLIAPFGQAALVPWDRLDLARADIIGLKRYRIAFDRDGVPPLFTAGRTGDWILANRPEAR